ncbi:tetratricopeptide repeat protein [Aliikangiella coralliicola]|nr:tetratricopeptide repeat protein [Aliikangiella coralliicola]
MANSKTPDMINEQGTDESESRASVSSISAPKKNAPKKAASNKTANDYPQQYMDEISDDSGDITPVKHLANAIPLTVSFVFLGIALILFESALSNREEAPIKVLVTTESDELAEENPLNNETENSSVDYSAKIIDLADEIESLYVGGTIEAAKIMTHPQVVALKNQNQTYSVIVHIVESLLARKDYTAALPLITPLEESIRDQYGLSFSYAKCLSNTGEIAQAIEQYQSLLAKRPAHQRASINLGLLLLRQNQFQQAKTLFASAVSYTSATRKAKSYAGLADAEVGLGEFQSSIANYKKAIEYRPSHPLTWRKLARAEQANGSPSKVVRQAYDKAVGIDPRNFRLLAEYADYLFSNMLYSEAISVLRKALKQSKESVNPRLLLLMSYLEQGRPLNASKQLRLLQKHISSNQEKTLASALEQYISKQYRPSLTTAKSSLKKNRDNNLAYYLIGRAYLALAKPRNAEIYLRKIATDSVYYLPGRYRLALALIERGANNKDKKVNQSAEEAEKKPSDNGVEMLAELFERLPDNHKIAYQVALQTYAKRKLSIAETAIDRAIQLRPKDKKYLLLKARILWRNGLSEQSVEQLQAILAENPRYKRAIYRLADYLEQDGKSDLALQTFESLTEVSREYSNTLYRIARLRSSQKQSQQALVLLEEYLQQKEGDVAARLLYARSFCETSQFNLCDKQIELILKLAPNNKDALELRRVFISDGTNSDQ